MAKPQPKHLVVCISNEGYLASLEKRKIYLAVRDAPAERRGLIRIVDESGEDYLIQRHSFARLPCLRPSRRLSWPLPDRRIEIAPANARRCVLRMSAAQQLIAARHC